MKRYLAIYIGTAEAMAKWNSMPEQELRERQTAGVKAWHEWVERNKASIVEIGAPLGRTKSVSQAGTADIRNSMSAFTVVLAQSHEAAAKLVEGHPHFTVFPPRPWRSWSVCPSPASRRAGVRPNPSLNGDVPHAWAAPPPRATGYPGSLGRPIGR